jgi:ABC-type sugar transport system permease subunit
MNVFPLVWSLYLSFCRYTDTANLPAEWTGGDNYARILSNPDIWTNFIVTAQFTLLSVGLQLFVGFGMALLLHRPFRLKGFVTTCILLPMMLSPVVVGLFWRFLLDANFGLVNWILQAVFRVQDPVNPINWLSDPRNAMWSLVIVDTWMWSPFVMLISLAGLSAVPPHLYEAAEVDRASGWFKFRHITLPMVAPLVMIALLFRTMDCFKIFDLVYVLTGGGPGDATKTVSYSLYKLAFDQHRTGYACALAYIILLVIIGLANLYIKFLGRVRGEGIPDSSSLYGAMAEKTCNVPIIGWLFDSPLRLFGVLLVGAISWQIPALWHFFRSHSPLIFALVVFGMGIWIAGQVTTTGHNVMMAAYILLGSLAFAVPQGVGIWLWPFGATGLIWLIARLPQRVRNLLAYLAIGVALFLYLLPIYWIVATSFKPATEIFAIPPKFVPARIAIPGETPPKGYTFGMTLRNYDALIYQREGNRLDGRIAGYSDFPRQLANSLLIGGVSTFLAVAMGTMAAYAFARFRIKAKEDLLFFILSTRMMPAIVVVIPIFLMYRTLGLLDTHLGLIILYTVFNLSFSTYLLKGFFDDIPHEYDDAALLDGYSRFQAFYKISLPQTLTGIAATAVFCFITAWNEFAFAQILAVRQPLTAPPSIVARTGAGGTEWGQIAAGAVLFLIPAAIFTFLMRKHLLRGVTFGAIKR